MGRVVVKFFDENNQYMTERWKGIWMDLPSVAVDLKTDDAIYGKGEIVNLALNLQNKLNYAYATTLKVKVSDPSNANIYSNTIQVTLAANGSSIQNLSLTLPSNAQDGFYTVSTEAYDTSGRKIGGKSGSFEVVGYKISAFPTMPEVLGRIFPCRLY